MTRVKRIVNLHRITAFFFRSGRRRSQLLVRLRGTPTSLARHLIVAGQVQDRVPDDLPRAMVGDLASSLYAVYLIMCARARSGCTLGPHRWYRARG